VGLNETGVQTKRAPDSPRDLSFEWQCPVFLPSQYETHFTYFSKTQNVTLPNTLLDPLLMLRKFKPVNLQETEYLWISVKASYITLDT